MKTLTRMLLLFAFVTPVLADNAIRLGNDAWPPFILEGEAQGTAEKLVCQALIRAGRNCRVEVDDWDSVLDSARSGEIDGIAAAWRSAEREEFLLFSEPYLTNRIVPVVRTDFDRFITKGSDLDGMKVALVSNYAYGEEIDQLGDGVTIVPAGSSRAALQAVLDGKADAALVDELVARSRLEETGYDGLTALKTVLAFRSLHFAVSRSNPEAQAILRDFHRSYKLMLSDGTVNEILKVDWLATDFGQAGNVNVVMRKGLSLDDLSNPTDSDAVFALEESEYQAIRRPNTGSAQVQYQVEGKSYSKLQTALEDVFGKDIVCKHQNYTSTFDCSGLFNKSR